VTTANEYRPDTVSPPGATIAGILSQRWIQWDDFACDMGMSLAEVSGLIRGDVEITEGVALRLYQVLGVSVSFWVNRERKYREHLAL